jgi:segregation and condensation protein B
MMEELKNIIESLLLVAEGPLTVERIKNVLTLSESKAIRAALEDLAREYEKRKGGFYLSEIAGGYQIRTRPEYNEYIKKLIQPSPFRISKAALETLAIIAYKQPVIRSDVEQIRGVDCGGILRMLMERKLIKVLGRKEIPGRPLIYATTKNFLELFSLKSIKDLPTLKEIRELGSASPEMTGEEAIEKPAQPSQTQPATAPVSQGDGNSDLAADETTTVEMTQDSLSQAASEQLNDYPSPDASDEEKKDLT